MSIVVTKSPAVLVGSTKPAATPAVVEQIRLSSFDKGLAFSPFTSFHVFTRPIHMPAETIRRSLGNALVHYFPIAGRAANDDGETLISCNDKGVAFVAASASCSLAEVKLFDPPFHSLLRDLAVDYPAPEGCRPSDPLLLMQVTEFSCGGYVVGTTWNHAIADGRGMAQFLQAVSELARGLPLPSILPVSCGDVTLPELPPLVRAIERNIVTLPPQGFVYQDITVPWKLINRIRAEEPCATVFEAVVAVLWRCRTRAVTTDTDVPAPLVFAANVRKLVGAMDGYYGNCITTAVIVPTSGEVANGDITDVARLIRQAKKGIPGQFKEAATGKGGSTRGVNMEEQRMLDVMFGYNAFFVSSWRGLGFGAADFGGGRPARVMCHVGLTAVPNCVACLPCKGKDGANVLALCVRKEHVNAFLAELASLTSSYGLGTRDKSSRLACSK